MPDVDRVSVSDETLTRDAARLADTVREAGALALRMFSTELKTWTKGAASPVSEADIAVNDLIEARLRSATPVYGWLSEESVDDPARIGKALTWIVDPIDGTRAYLARQRDWSVSIALVGNGAPLLAVVFAPASEQFFSAIKGRGAKLNDAPIAVAPGAEINFPKIAGPKPLVERLEHKYFKRDRSMNGLNGRSVLHVADHGQPDFEPFDEDFRLPANLLLQPARQVHDHHFPQQVQVRELIVKGHFGRVVHHARRLLGRFA